MSTPTSELIAEAKDYREWPDNVLAIVIGASVASYENDFGTDQCIALGVLMALEELSRPAEVVPATIAALRHECAKSGPCSDNGDGCTCTAGELANRHNFINAAIAPPRSYEDGVRDAAALARARVGGHSERQRAAFQSGDDRTGYLHHAHHVEAAEIATAIEALLTTPESPK